MNFDQEKDGLPAEAYDEAYDESYYEPDDEAIPELDEELSTNVSHSYPSAPRQHLIDYCTNEWRANAHYRTPSSSTISYTWVDRCDDCMDSLVDRSSAIVRAPRLRRLLIGVILATTLFLYAWIWHVWPYIQEARATIVALEAGFKPATGAGFGSNLRPSFPDMIQIDSLRAGLMPRGQKPRFSSASRRLIFVGDIHGCKEELLSLLDKARFNPSTDHIIAAGDMVNKGPDSTGVVDVLRNANASCVRGNHEDRILLTVDGLDSPLLYSDQGSPPTFRRKGEESLSWSDAKERELARSLTKDQLAYLKSCPVILRVGEMRALEGEIIVVHAGLVPDVPLEKQDPGPVMNMRIIHSTTHVPSKQHEDKGSVPWAALWNKYQYSLPTQHSSFPSADEEEQESRQQHQTVIYGHDSKRGLQLEKYTKGLDTGCVKGGKLTALILSDGARWETVQVNCKDYRPKRPTSIDLDDILKFGMPGVREDLDDDFD